MRRTNQEGIRLIREFEGEILKGYLDAIGKLTIGVGHLVKPGEPYKLGQSIAREESERLLREDLRDAESSVERLVKVSLTDNQFAALVSLVFNIGAGNFGKSTLLRYLNQGRYINAASEFLKWKKAGGKVLKGLVRRRLAERELFELDDVDEDLPDIEEIASDAPVQPEPAQTPAEPEIVARAPQGAQESPSATAAPIVSTPSDAPVQASQGGKKSLWATIGGSLGGVMTAIGGFLKGETVLIIVGAVCITALLLTLIFRQVIMDYLRMKLQADPTKHNVK
jgi:lysozyme